MKKYVHVVRERRLIIEQVIPVVPARTCDLSVTVEPSHQELRIFEGECNSNVVESLKLRSSTTAGSDACGFGVTQDWGLYEGEWYLNGIDSTPGLLPLLASVKSELVT